MDELLRIRGLPADWSSRELRICHLAVRALAHLGKSEVGVSALDALRSGEAGSKQTEAAGSGVEEKGTGVGLAAAAAVSGPEGLLPLFLREWAEVKVTMSGRVKAGAGGRRARSNSVEDAEGAGMGALELQRGSAAVLGVWQELADEELLQSAFKGDVDVTGTASVAPGLPAAAAGGAGAGSSAEEDLDALDEEDDGNAVLAAAMQGQS